MANRIMVNKDTPLTLTWPFYLSIFLIIIPLAFLWGWKTSGVLENSMLWHQYPEGYTFILHTPSFGDWPINKESQYYLSGALGFVNESGFTLNVGSGYEIYRTLYSFLLRSFWFLHPMIAVLLLDVIIWFSAVLSILYVATQISRDRLFILTVALLALFGQGFMQSVGEGMGHVLGYASGYFILALTAYLAPWKESASWRTDVPIYAFIGIWQLAYGTAFFHLPFPLLATLYRLRHESFIHQAKQAAPLVFVALFPYLCMSLMAALFMKGSTGALSIILERISGQQFSWYSFTLKYLIVLLDSILSLGPLALLGIAGFVIKTIQKDKLFSALFVVLLIQFAGMAFLLIPLSGRGYTTFNFSPLLCLGGGVFCSTLYQGLATPFLKKAALTTITILVILYPNASKLGWRLPNQIFFIGFNQIFSSWEPYERRLFS